MTSIDMNINATGDLGTQNTFVGVGNGANYNNYPKVNAVYNITTDRRPKALRITEIINCLDERAQNIKPDGWQPPVLFYIEEKIEFNSLKRWRKDVCELSVYSGMVSRIYKEFDENGRNKSRNVMLWLNYHYRQLSDNHKGDELFDLLLERVCEEVSGDFRLKEDIMEEDLIYNARIVLVDAFIKCKIFEKPVSAHAYTT